MQHVVIVTADKDGKVTLNKDELQEMLNEAYNNGYSDGKASQCTITYPSWIYRTNDLTVEL